MALSEKWRMYRSLFLAAALAAAAGAVAAQPEPPQALFISPAGEPFRAQPGEAYPLAKWFAGADANHDGALSATEFDADALRFFDVLDLNHDGKLTNLETQNYEDKVAPEIVRKIPLLSDRGPGRGSDPMKTLPTRSSGPARLRPPSEGAGFYSLLNEPQPVTGADTDFNTIITRAEWSAAAKRRFGRLDKNTDWSLRLDELPVPPAQQAAQAEPAR
jgi:hypothetical protein